MRRRSPLRRQRRGRRGVSGRRSLAPKAWDTLKQAVFVREAHRCAVPWCRKKAALDAHHVLKRSQGGADAMDNLVALDRGCHDDTDRPLNHRRRLTVLRLEEPREGDFYGFWFFRSGTSLDTKVWHKREAPP